MGSRLIWYAFCSSKNLIMLSCMCHMQRVIVSFYNLAPDCMPTTRFTRCAPAAFTTCLRAHAGMHAITQLTIRQGCSSHGSRASSNADSASVEEEQVLPVLPISVHLQQQQQQPPQRAQVGPTGASGSHGNIGEVPALLACVSSGRQDDGEEDSEEDVPQAGGISRGASGGWHDTAAAPGAPDAGSPGACALSNAAARTAERAAAADVKRPAEGAPPALELSGDDAGAPKRLDQSPRHAQRGRGCAAWAGKDVTAGSSLLRPPEADASLDCPADQQLQLQRSGSAAQASMQQVAAATEGSNRGGEPLAAAAAEDQGQFEQANAGVVHGDFGTAGVSAPGPVQPPLVQCLAAAATQQSPRQRRRWAAGVFNPALSPRVRSVQLESGGDAREDVTHGGEEGGDGAEESAAVQVTTQRRGGAGRPDKFMQELQQMQLQHQELGRDPGSAAVAPPGNAHGNASRGAATSPSEEQSSTFVPVRWSHPSACFPR